VPTSALPTITDPVTIDGYTQPGANANTLTDGDNAVLLIELNGTNAGPGVVGLLITASDSKVKGLIINRFSDDAIRLEDGSGSTIAGNFLGTDASGKIALGNVGNGVHMEDSANNLVGGIKPAARNILSGNHHEGVEVEESLSTGNRIQGNFIGTDASGTVALPNLDEGVEIDAAAHNLVGGTAPGAGNLISGNAEYGILFYTDGATDNRVQNNVIGLDVTRTKKLGNSHGVKILDVPDNIIGGTEAGAGNLIAGNNIDGVWIDGSHALGNVVQGNLIGAGIGGITLGIAARRRGLLVDVVERAGQSPPVDNNPHDQRGHNGGRGRISAHDECGMGTEIHRDQLPLAASACIISMVRPRRRMTSLRMEGGWGVGVRWRRYKAGLGSRRASEANNCTVVTRGMRALGEAIIRRPCRG